LGGRFPRALLTLEFPLAPLPLGQSPSVPLGVDRLRLRERALVAGWN